MMYAITAGIRVHSFNVTEKYFLFLYQYNIVETITEALKNLRCYSVRSRLKIEMFFINVHVIQNKNKLYGFSLLRY